MIHSYHLCIYLGNKHLIVIVSLFQIHFLTCRRNTVWDQTHYVRTVFVILTEVSLILINLISNNKL